MAEYSKEILQIAAELNCEPKAVAEVRALPPADLEALTNAYLNEVHQSPSYWRLLPARDLTTLYLIAAFEREQPFTRNDEAYTDTPASRALAFLDLGVHEALKDHLLRWLRTGDETVLRAIGTALVAFGTDDLLPHVRVLFEHEDELVSSGARAGVLYAVKAGRAEPEFRSFVWEHCKQLLHSEEPPLMYDPIRLLIAIDSEAIKKVLLDPIVMHRDHPLLAEALSHLNALRSPPVREFLNSLIADETIEPDHRKKGIHKSAILGLVILQDPTARAHVERVLAEPKKFEPTTVLAAWSARFKLNGLTSVHDAAFKNYKNADQKIEKLSPDERDVMLFHLLHQSVRAVGFWQWYANDHVKFGAGAKTSLQKIGATKHEAILNEANQLFGPNGPPDSPEKIRIALEAMPKKKIRRLEKLSDVWIDLPSWDLEIMHWDWNRQNTNDPSEKQ